MLKLPFPVFEECSWMAFISVSILGRCTTVVRRFLQLGLQCCDYISKVVFAVADATEQFSGRLVFK